MFIGHIAVGLAAEGVAPKTSLGLLVAAPLAADLLWSILVLAGVERVRIDPGNTAFTPLAFTYYPWTHSLLMSLALSALAGAAYWLWRHYRAGALVIAAGVLSHWAGHAALSGRLHHGRPGIVEFLPGHAGGGVRDVCGGGVAVRQRDEVQGPRGQLRTLGVCRVSAGGVCDERLRTAAAFGARDRIRGPGAVAAAAMGVVVRRSPHLLVP
jgi:hypothetical protein